MLYLYCPGSVRSTKIFGVSCGARWRVSVSEVIMIKGGGASRSKASPGRSGKASETDKKFVKLWHFWTTSVWCLLCKQGETRRACWLHAISQAKRDLSFSTYTVYEHEQQSTGTCMYSHLRVTIFSQSGSFVMEIMSVRPAMAQCAACCCFLPGPRIASPPVTMAEASRLAFPTAKRLVC